MVIDWRPKAVTLGRSAAEMLATRQKKMASWSSFMFVASGEEWLNSYYAQ
jgi:hypothetical protein